MILRALTSPQHNASRCTPPSGLQVALCLLLLASCVTTQLGCASYSELLDDTRHATSRGDLDGALHTIHARLNLESDLEQPASLRGDHTLLLMERAVILQGQGSYKLSSRDMITADNYLEFLDVEGSSVDDLGKYLYSDSSSKYRAPAYERLILNILNMINFLALYDLEGARVEARRFAVMERYFVNDEGKALMPGLLAAGNYLAAATYEASRDYREAARAYSRAWSLGMRDAPTRERLLDLYRLTGYKPRDQDSPFFDQLLDEARQAGSISRADYAAKHQQGDTLIITQYGFVPYKTPQRMATQRAVSMAQSSRTYNSRDNVSIQLSTLNANKISTVNFPVLTESGLPRRTPASASVEVNGRRLTTPLGVDLGQSVQQAWSEIAGPLMIAALTRSVTRSLLGEGGRVVSQQATRSEDPNTVALGLLGWLVSSSAEAAMSAADTPDTRSWSTLPAHIRITRAQLPQGLQRVDARIDGQLETQLAPIWSEQLNLINFSRNR